MGYQTPIQLPVSPNLGHSMDRIKDQHAAPIILHRVWYDRGKKLTQQGYYDAALSSFDIALKLQPQEHQIWAYRGIVFAYLNCYESALASFEKALELAPDNRELWVFRGATLKYLNRSQASLESYNRALTIQQQGFTICEDYPTSWIVSMDMKAAG